jgi:uncharacterized protein YndB with AHSA1/START domain
MYGTYETIDGRPAVRFERRYDHPVEAVWRAVTEPGELAHWFPARVSVDDLRAGAAMRFDFGEGMVMDGAVVELDEPRVFAFRWRSEHLRFELEAIEGGAATRLRFTHVLDEADTAARNAAGWHVCLQRLGARLAGDAPDAPGSSPTPEWRALYDAYVERGVPSGAAIPTPGN